MNDNPLSFLPEDIIYTISEYVDPIEPFIHVIFEKYISEDKNYHRRTRYMQDRSSMKEKLREILTDMKRTWCASMSSRYRCEQLFKRVYVYFYGSDEKILPQANWETNVSDILKDDNVSLYELRDMEHEMEQQRGSLMYIYSMLYYLGFHANYRVQLDKNRAFDYFDGNWYDLAKCIVNGIVLGRLDIKQVLLLDEIVRNCKSLNPFGHCSDYISDVIIFLEKYNYDINLLVQVSDMLFYTIILKIYNGIDDMNFDKLKFIINTVEQMTNDTNLQRIIYDRIYHYTHYTKDFTQIKQMVDALKQISNNNDLLNAILSLDDYYNLQTKINYISSKPQSLIDYVSIINNFDFDTVVLFENLLGEEDPEIYFQYLSRLIGSKFNTVLKKAKYLYYPESELLQKTLLEFLILSVNNDDYDDMSTMITVIEDVMGIVENIRGTNNKIKYMTEWWLKSGL